MIAIVDYGAGNLASVRKALSAAGADVFTPAAPADLSCASAVVVPGVGHFAATAALDGAWRGAILDAVADGRPLLGICLGMQWLFEGSDEAPDCPGLGVLAGRCVRLDTSAGAAIDAIEAARPDPTAAHRGVAVATSVSRALKVPHVGWNRLTLTRPSSLLAGIDSGSHVYFTHAYAAPVTADCCATTDYGGTFASAVVRGRVWGVQFHPEKSGQAGTTVMENFVRSAARTWTLGP